MRILDSSIKGRRLYLTVSSETVDEFPVVRYRFNHQDTRDLTPAAERVLDDHKSVIIYEIPLDWIDKCRESSISRMPVQVCHASRFLREFTVDLGFFISPIGVLDSFKGNSVTGWAWDPRQPDTGIDIQITVHGSNIERQNIKAMKFRNDLYDHGIGNGCHGFVLNFPTAFALNTKIEVSIPGAAPLMGSPKFNTPGDSRLDEVAAGDPDHGIYTCIFRTGGRMNIR